MGPWRTPVVVIVALIAVAVTAPAVPAAARCYPLEDFMPDAVTTLDGDVAGNLAADTVTSRGSWIDADTCRAHLRVETSSDRIGRRIDPLTGSMLAPPALVALVLVGAGHRLDIAVVPWTGASSAFVDLYGIRDGVLVRFTRRAFSYAGSVLERSGVDCAQRRGADVVASRAVYGLDGRYHVERVFYAFRDARLQARPRLTEFDVVRTARLERLPEFAATAPFPSCTVVAGL